jgi:hypothetical protein
MCNSREGQKHSIYKKNGLTGKCRENRCFTDGKKAKYRNKSISGF